MQIIDLFSGIGGFSLAGHWLGWETIQFCEINPWCHTVLKYYYPNVPIASNIFDLTVDNIGNFLYLCPNGDIIMGNKKSTKYDNAVLLYESGLSIQDCAEFFNISRQAMHKILIRRNCKMRDQVKFGEENHFYRGCYGDNDKKKRIQHILDKAVRKGIVIPSSTCQVCGDIQDFSDGRRGIQAHHNDYDKPLEVVWMCQKCHHKWHTENKPLNDSNEGETIEGSHLGTGQTVLTGGFP